MSLRPLHVLVLCTGNSARSILAEALLNHLGQGRIRAYSAGSKPAGKVNPLALRTLRENKITVAETRSKSWEEFAHAGAPHMDIVITVCDSAAGETCPLWPGTPVMVHWGLPDPAQAVGTEAERLHAFAEAYRMIEKRVRQLVALRPAHSKMISSRLHSRLAHHDPLHENRQLEAELRRIHIEA